MKRLYILVFALLFWCKGYAQYPTNSYKLFQVFGAGITNNPSTQPGDQTKYINNNTSATKTSTRDPGISGLNWMDFLSKGYIFWEEYLGGTTIRQHLYINIEATTAFPQYWSISRLSMSSAGNLQTPVSNFDWWMTSANTSINPKTAVAVSFVPNAAPAINDNAYVDLHVIHLSRDTKDYGASHSNLQAEGDVRFRFIVENVDILATARVPDVVNISSGKILVMSDGVADNQTSIAGPGVAYQNATFNPYVPGGTYLNPAGMNPGPNVYTSSGLYFNGNATISRTINLCSGVPSAPSITASGSTSLCNGQSVTLNATGNNVSWSNGQAGNSITVSSPGSYYAVDNSSCGSSAASNVITITSGSSPSAPSLSADNTFLCNGSSTNLYASSSGASYYYWYKDGTYYTEGPAAITVSSAGNYVAYGSNGCGWSPSSSVVTINTGSSPSAPSISLTGDLCSGNAELRSDDGQAVNWYWNGAYHSTGITLPCGQGTAYATRSNSCGESAAGNSITVNPIPPSQPSNLSISVTQPTCSQNTGTITVGATAPTGATLSYALPGITNWQSSNQFSVAPGTYKVWVSAVRGSCSSDPIEGTVTVNPVPNPIPAAPEIRPNGSTTLCNGTTLVLSSTGSNILWSNGMTGNSITVNQAGSYFATSASDCGISERSNVIDITVSSTPAAPVITASTGNPLCNGATVVLSSTGSNILWSNGMRGNSILVSDAGTYTATQSNVCGISPESNTLIVTLSKTPLAPTITANGTTALCNGATVTLTSTGSDVLWSNGKTGNTIIVSDAGTYSARDMNVCGTSAPSNEITITTGATPKSPIITTNGPTQLCNGGSVVLTATGEGIITWVYENGSGGQSIFVGKDLLVKWDDIIKVPNRSRGFYVTSKNSCGESQLSFISVSAGNTVTPVITSNATVIFDTEPIYITSTLSDPKNNIVWNIDGVDRNTDPSFGKTVLTVNTPGVYSSREISINGCKSELSNKITIVRYSDPTNPPVIQPPGDVDVIDNPDGTKTILFCTGRTVELTSPVADSYQWYKDGQLLNGETNRILKVSANGDYTVKITKSGSSYTTKKITVELYPLPNKPLIQFND